MIRNPEYARRLPDYTGVRFGKKSMTNLDGFMDIAGELFVFVETKYQGSSMDLGQRIAIERLCDATEKGGVASVVFFCWHGDCTEIDYGSLPVIRYRWKGEWRKPQKQILLPAAIAELGKRYTTVKEFREHGAWVSEYEANE